MVLYSFLADMILAGVKKLGDFGNNHGIHDAVKAELERRTGVIWTDDGPTDEKIGEGSHE